LQTSGFVRSPPRPLFPRLELAADEADESAGDAVA